MRLSSEVKKFKSSPPYQPGMSFDPRLADAAYALLKQKQTVTSAPPPPMTIDSSVPLQGMSFCFNFGRFISANHALDRLQNLHQMLQWKQEEHAKVHKEVIEVKSQIERLEFEDERRKTLRRAGSWSGSSRLFAGVYVFFL